MKLTVQRNALLKALGHIQRVVERRNTYPILANVLLWAEGDRLGLRATDLDIEITNSIEAVVGAPGRTTVPAHKLYEITRKLPDGGEIRFEGDGASSMTISSGRSRFNLACIGPESFPDLKSGNFSSSFEMPATDLLALLEQTGFAASTEETRYYLNGIHMHPLEVADGVEIRAVATDGHRLARTEVPAPAGARTLPRIIVPRKTVNEMSKLLDGVGDDVKVDVSDTKIRVEIGETVLLSKLIEGTFPDYDRVTPKNNDKRLVVDRKELATAVDRVSTIASDSGGKAVRIAASPTALVVSVTNPDHGEAREEMPVEFEHDDFQVGCNAKYLLDIVGQLKGDEIAFYFNDAGSPMLIKETDEAGRALYVLMPMRI